MNLLILCKFNIAVIAKIVNSFLYIISNNFSQFTRNKLCTFIITPSVAR